MDIEVIDGRSGGQFVHSKFSKVVNGGGLILNSIKIFEGESWDGGIYSPPRQMNIVGIEAITKLRDFLNEQIEKHTEEKK